MRKFRNVVFWFVALLLLAVGGFWKSYFSILFRGVHLTHHFHAVVMMAWILLLIGQAWLIRARKFALHRQTSRLSYLLAPVIVLSGIIVSFYTLGELGADRGAGGFWFGLFASTLFGLLYGLAVIYRHNINLHARYMITTGLIFVVPSFGRLYFTQLVPLGFPPVDALVIQAVPALLGMTLIGWDWIHDRIRAPFVVFTLLWGVHLVAWQSIPDWECWQSFTGWAANFASSY